MILLRYEGIAIGLLQVFICLRCSSMTSACQPVVALIACWHRRLYLASQLTYKAHVTP